MSKFSLSLGEYSLILKLEDPGFILPEGGTYCDIQHLLKWAPGMLTRILFWKFMMYVRKRKYSIAVKYLVG